MNRGTLWSAVRTALELPVLALCLFWDCPTVKTTHLTGSFVAEASAILRDSTTQWMIFVCAGSYLAGLIILRRRGAGPGRAGTHRDASLPSEVWLGGLMLAAATAYGLGYLEAAASTQALTLPVAAVLGQGAAFWEARREKVGRTKGAGGTVLALIILLAGAAVWRTETAHFFRYRGQARWSGPWDNPNVFGVLMGVGVVLAAGRLVQSPRSKVYSLKSWGREHRTSNTEHRTLKLGPWLTRGFFLAAAGVMGVGLVKSYSRGAWVGAALGLAYLGYFVAKAESRKQKWGGGKLKC